MNWYQKLASSSTDCGHCQRVTTAAIGHCLDRVDGRLAPYAQELRQSVDAAEDIYGHLRMSVAVCVKELPAMHVMNKVDDTSNGDWVVIILRPRGFTSECITTMLRRSPNRKQAPQPFTPAALRVDKVVRYQQFLADIQRSYAQPSKAQPTVNQTKPQPSAPAPSRLDGKRVSPPPLLAKV